MMNTGFPGEGFAGIIIFAVIAIFAFVIISIVVSAAKGINEWSHNNSQPVLTVPAKVVTKRSQVGVSHHHHDSHVHHRSSTTYFATFELENGERMEFSLSGKDSGLLVEGDHGDLTYQGTRYHGFSRKTGTQQS
jgi:hypothetical protein